jgi:chemotaxis protein MotB
MKTFSFIAATFVALTLLTSCASSKKYQSALVDKQALQQKYDQLQKENEQLKSSTSAEQQAMDTKEKSLTTEEDKLKELKSLIDQQRDALNNLRQEVCGAVKCFTPDQLTVEVRDGKLYVHMSDKLLFPTAGTDVNAEGKKAISYVADVLKKSDLEIEIEGHTDSVPIHNSLDKDNWDLSARRATSVARIFIEDGVQPTRMIVSGRGKYLPLASNATTEGRAQNRRTDIVLAPKLDQLWKLAEEESNDQTGLNKPNDNQ